MNQPKNATAFNYVFFVGYSHLVYAILITIESIS